jgi:hypothetical protein
LSANVFTRSQLHYSDDLGDGAPLALYIYRADGLHTGAHYIANDAHEDREIAPADARFVAEHNMDAGREIRITNSADHLVFHAKDGKVIYPADPEMFWKAVQG